MSASGGSGLTPECPAYYIECQKFLAYWAALLTSSCSARLPLTTRRPCRSR